MKRLALALLIACTTTSLVTGCGSSAKTKEAPVVNQKQAAVEEFVKTKNIHVLQTEEQDLFNDKNKEKVVLYGEQAEDGMPISWSLVIDNIEKVKLLPEDGLYSFAEFKFEDVNGDNNKEVLIYRYSSGSAGARGLNIYQSHNNVWQEIFSVKNPVDEENNRYEVKYLGDYYASFEDKETGLKSAIELDKNKYNGIEDMLKGISTWIDPIADYSIVDHDGDGVKEIITIQRVIGVSHADTLALLKTTYKLEKAKYKAVTIILTNSNDKPLAEIKL